MFYEIMYLIKISNTIYLNYYSINYHSNETIKNSSIKTYSKNTLVDHCTFIAASRNFLNALYVCVYLERGVTGRGP